METLRSTEKFVFNTVFFLYFSFQRWNNEYISWDPDQFCGIDNVSLPNNILWKPDLTIEEM